MQPFVLAVGALMALFQPGINEPRKAFVDCLRDAGAKAQSSSVAAADYAKFAVETCTTQAAAFRAGLVNFDVKNGIKRAQAVSDADAQIDDYVAMSAEKYGARSKPQP